MAGNAGISEYFINTEPHEITLCSGALKKIGLDSLAILIESTYSDTFGANTALTQIQRDEMIYALSDSQFEKDFGELSAEFELYDNTIFEFLEDRPQ